MKKIVTTICIILILVILGGVAISNRELKEKLDSYTDTETNAGNDTPMDEQYLTLDIQGFEIKYLEGMTWSEVAEINDCVCVESDLFYGVLIDGYNVVFLDIDGEGILVEENHKIRPIEYFLQEEKLNYFYIDGEIYYSEMSSMLEIIGASESFEEAEDGSVLFEGKYLEYNGDFVTTDSFEFGLRYSTVE